MVQYIHIERDAARDRVDETNQTNQTNFMKTKITTGTNHFSTETAAVAYYSAYGCSRRDVVKKIANGGITIGKPTAKPGEVLSLHPREGRYFITTNPAPKYIQRRREAQEASLA